MKMNDAADESKLPAGGFYPELQLLCQHNGLPAHGGRFRRNIPS